MRYSIALLFMVIVLLGGCNPAVAESYAVVRDGLPFYEQKTADSRMLRLIPYGGKVELVEKSGEWTEILFYGESGFVRSSGLSNKVVYSEPLLRGTYFEHHEKLGSGTQLLELRPDSQEFRFTLNFCGSGEDLTGRYEIYAPLWHSPDLFSLRLVHTSARVQNPILFEIFGENRLKLITPIDSACALQGAEYVRKQE
ncbi:MAG: hypothetical protein KDK39_02570 [Leptospiraceae bacterium]|nr:hypothetical protein [Leptospiraceae bacterium]